MTLCKLVDGAPDTSENALWKEHLHSFFKRLLLDCRVFLFFIFFFFYQFYLGPRNKQKRSKAKNINNYFKMAATYVPTRSEVDQLYAEYEEIRRA